MNNPEAKIGLSQDNLFFNMKKGESSPAIFMFPNLGLYVEIGSAPLEEMIITPQEMAVHLGLIGRSLIITATDNKQIDTHEKKLTKINQSIEEINRETDLNLKMFSSPLYVFFNLENGNLELLETMRKYSLPWRNLGKKGFDKQLVEASRNLNNIDMNQFSPYVSRLFSQVKNMFPQIDLDIDEYEKKAKSVGRFFDKTEYVMLVEKYAKDHGKEAIPLHTPTMLLSLEEFMVMESFEGLQNIFLQQTGNSSSGLFVKLTLGSGGAMQEIINKENFLESKDQLKTSTQKSRLHSDSFALIMQRVIESSDTQNTLPARIGVNIYIYILLKKESRRLSQQRDKFTKIKREKNILVLIGNEKQRKTF